MSQKNAAVMPSIEAKTFIGGFLMGNDEAVGEIERLHKVLNDDPAEYIRFYTARLTEEPNNSSAYFSRHMGWEKIRRFDLALADLSRSLELEPSCIVLLSRGELHMQLGQFREAKTDFLRGQALNPEEWKEIFGHISLACCHALLGEREAAMKICNNLPPDHWSPPVQRLVRGGGRDAVVESINKIMNTRRRSSESDGDAADRQKGS